MSWSIQATGENRAAVEADLDEKLIANAQHCPLIGRIQTAAGVLMDQMPPESVRRIETYGHINADGTGFVSVKVNQ